MSTEEPKKKRSDAGTPRTAKRLSCQRCRVRKVKCSYDTPCTNCVKDNIECVQPIDLRSKRPKATQVIKLENKVNLLVKFINNFKDCPNIDAKNELISNTNLDELLNYDGISTSQPANNIIHDQHDEEGSGGISAVYGPTSVYGDAIMSNTLKSMTKTGKDNSIDTINKLRNDPDVIKCVQLFFRWQYPDHNMFIFRESFLVDFFTPKHNSLYCSKTLILSICALGARMSDDKAIYNKSKEYYQESKALLLSSMNHPSITSLQSFMLLSFYDTCNGHNSSGWMLSGCAIRMGFDLGFQLNPELWFVKSKNDVGEEDVAIRSRVYWGCYMADHFISLILGRPSILKMSDASIPETGDLPDLEWIDDFTYAGYLKQKGLDQDKPTSYISDPLNQIINLINISDNMLNDIFTKSDDANNEDLNLNSRWEKLFQYNKEITQWKRNLPKDLNWTRESLKASGENPTYSGIRYYYYILLLCLNRPFVGIENEENTNDELSPLSICLDAIDDLYESINRFQTQHGYRVCSIFIVYSSILSISILLLTNSRIQLVSEQKDRLHFFMSVLHGCSKTWKLAERSYNLIKEKIKHSPMKLENTAPATTSPSNNTLDKQSTAEVPTPLSSVGSITDQQQPFLFDDSIDFLGGPPVLMTADLFNEDWEALFPDYVFNSKN
ncbi:hypothetical protein SBY92_000233 [Candida maltosa Xu316]